VALEKRTFVIRNDDGTESGVFEAREPNRAAKKAAIRMFNPGQEGVIKLRQRGTKKVKIYKAKVFNAPKPPNAPAWLKSDTVKKCSTEYMGQYYLED